MKNAKSLLIAAIRRDSGAQFRVGGLNEQHVADMVEAIERGDKLPAIVVFFDGAFYWMGGGDHRIEAHIRTGKKKIEAEVRDGTQADAEFYGAGDNADHGLVRTPK
ncbi:streptomycin biosynthesis regulator, partial [bacterium]